MNNINHEYLHGYAKAPQTQDPRELFVRNQQLELLRQVEQNIRLQNDIYHGRIQRDVQEMKEIQS